MTMKSKINRFSHNGYTQEGNTIRKSGEILTNLPPKTAVWVGSGGVQAVSNLNSGHIRNIIKYAAKNWLKTPNSTISGNWVDELLDRFAAVELSKVLAEKRELLAQIECLTREVSTLKCAVEDTAYLLADVRHLENQLKRANEQIDDLQQLVEDLKAHNADADALAAECVELEDRLAENQRAFELAKQHWQSERLASGQIIAILNKIENIIALVKA